jgi:hypothetical protein
MTVDYRQLLKDTVRGMIWDNDIPASPASLNTAGEAVATKREALEVFWSMVDEIIIEQGGESRPMVARELARLKRLDLRRRHGNLKR